MEYWEFLLQKEGDRSWLPLESPDVEILEGRYRIVARSSRKNINVEVRITHHSAEEVPPKRRIQKRTNRTNQDGLMVVFPFTRLQPGLWELRCSGDLMSEFLGKTWQYAVRLQVLPQENEVPEDWEDNWAAPEPAETSSTAEAPSQLEASPEADQPLETAPVAEVAETPSEAIAAFATETAASSPETAATPNLEDPLRTIEVKNYSVEDLQRLAEQIAQLKNALASTSASTPAPDSSSLDSPVPPLTDAVNGSAEPAIADANTEDLISNPASEPVTAIAQTLHIVLTQENYMAHWGSSFTLIGQLEAESASSEPLPSQAVPHSPIGELYLTLRDPQTAQIWVERHQPFPSQRLPFPFSCTFEIPLECKTRLLLGEIVFYNHDAPSSTSPIALATHSFTITADLEELLEAVADDWNEESLLGLVPEAEPEEPQPVEKPSSDLSYLNLSFLNLGEDPSPKPFRIQSSAGQPLPPQIYKPEIDKAASRSLDLPSFPSPQALQNTPSQLEGQEEASLIDDSALEETALTDEPVADEVSEQPNDADTPSDADISSDDVTMALFDLDEAEASEHGDAELALETESPVTAIDSDEDNQSENDLNAATETGGDRNTDLEELPSIDKAFQALNLKERFWTRLNAIATDAELSTWLKNGSSDPESQPNEPASSPPQPEVTPAPEPIVEAPQPQRASSRTEERWAAQEIVVEDEPTHTSSESSPAPSTPELEPTILPKDTPVPTPQLEVPSGELTSGNLVSVKVKLPNLSARVYAKLWLNDRQTRSLLDGPRWLVDFTPTGFGDVEAVTQLTVPFGSLEIQFEVVAVEMATQRESHKVTIERSVVPPDSPSLSLDEWES